MTNQPPNTTDEAWRILQLGGGRTEFSIATVRLALDVGYGPVRLGLGEEGEPRLLIPTDVGRRHPDGLSGPGIRVRAVQYVVDGRTRPFIEVSCGLPELDEVFRSLTDEILRRLHAGSAPEAAVAQAIAEFRDLLRRDYAHSLEMLVGLFGELHLLNELLGRNPMAAFAWTGPLRQRYDFSSPRLCAEVKTTLRRTGSVVRVSSLEQLEPAEDGRPLILVHAVLERAGTGGHSVRDLIEQARQHSADPDVIDRALSSLDLHDWRSLTPLADDKFVPLRQQLYEIGPGFPRLGCQSFMAGQPPLGVNSITYSIDLGHAEAFRIDIARRAHLLDQLASST